MTEHALDSRSRPRHTTPVAPLAAQPLTVLAAGPDDGHQWAPLVGAVAGALGLEPPADWIDVGAKDVAARLEVAAACSGPVLLLPARRSRRARDREVNEVGTAVADERAPFARALIPSDASDEVAAGARAMMQRLAAAGVSSTILHVVTTDNVPRMWEGPGHHARAWFTELFRRHGDGPDLLRVEAGHPAQQVTAYAASVDVVVVLWHGRAAPGRTIVLRSLLERDLDVPVLLVPLAWVRRSHRVRWAAGMASSRR
jgi:hypothetical protein